MVSLHGFANRGTDGDAQQVDDGGVRINRFHRVPGVDDSAFEAHHVVCGVPAHSNTKQTGILLALLACAPN